MTRTPTRRAHKTPPLLPILRTPLARWGFTLLATYGWRTRPRRRRIRR